MNKDPFQKQNPNLISKALQKGIHAFNINRIPAVLLWISGIFILASWYFIPGGKSIWNEVAELKMNTGFIFPIISTALAGGLIPFLMQFFQKGRTPDFRFSLLIFTVLFWGIKGIEIDLLYKGLAVWFGDSNEPKAVLIKVFFDQFIYVPLWAVPTMVVAYTWKENGFKLQKETFMPFKSWLQNEYIPIFLMNSMIWIPAVFIIYLLPLSIQLPVQNIILCFFSLVIMITTEKQKVV